MWKSSIKSWSKRISMTNLTAEIVEALTNHHHLALATIVSRNGSAPRTAGARMIIRADGNISGTIGGGLLEAQCIKTASEVFITHAAVLKEFHLTGKDAASSDMICGGIQEALIEFLDAEDTDLLTSFQAALQYEQTRQRSWWIIELPINGKGITRRIPRWFAGADGKITAHAGICTDTTIQFPSGEPSTSLNGQPAYILMEVDKVSSHVDLPHEPQVFTVSSKRFYIEPLSHYGTVYIFGAGHVSQKLASLTSMVGFRTVVLDDRAEFANQNRFPTAHEIMVLRENLDALREINLDRDSYIVIVTRGHVHDKVILEQALGTNAVYIGMIGSKRKREEIYRALESQGISRGRLAQVHSPIGLPIESESPEEIAVSITAELIQCRARYIARKS